jgi:hypothetical protein
MPKDKHHRVRMIDRIKEYETRLVKWKKGNPKKDFDEAIELWAKRGGLNGQGGQWIAKDQAYEKAARPLEKDYPPIKEPLPEDFNIGPEMKFATDAIRKKIIPDAK